MGCELVGPELFIDLLHHTCMFTLWMMPINECHPISLQMFLIMFVLNCFLTQIQGNNYVLDVFGQNNTSAFINLLGLKRGSIVF